FVLCMTETTDSRDSAAEHITAAGGVAHVARQLGVSYMTARAWALGARAPRPEVLRRIIDLPPTPARTRARLRRRESVRSFGPLTAFDTPPVDSADDLTDDFAFVAACADSAADPDRPSAADLHSLIEKAGGPGVVSRTLGLTWLSVWNWSRGAAKPRPENLARLRLLPATPKPCGGRPATPRIVDRVLVEELILRAGNVSAAARAVGVTRQTVHQYRRGNREMPLAFAERVRRYLAQAMPSANGQPS
ncbi:MAG: hypothetical protein ACHQQR_11925, partial [Gemmatimonadales bacterium]